MEKIRIYELARELGLENKAVLELCKQLGMEGKRSHSNSLTVDEADRVRREVIRSAVNERQGSVREVKRDGGVVTERRVGNVVRRRRKTATEEAQSEPSEDLFEDKPNIDLNEARDAAGEFAPALDPQKESRERKEALERADALFAEDAEAEKADLEEEKEELASPPTALEEPTEPPSAEAAVTAEETTEQELEAAVPAESSELEPDSASEALPSEQIEEEDNQEAAEELAAVRKRHDIRAPKILGKIDLPVAEPAPAKDTSSKSSAAEGGSQYAEPSSPGSGRGSKRSGKSSDSGSDDRGRTRRRKKHIVKKDELLDYGGDSDNWRGRRDKKLKKSRDKREDGVAGQAEQIAAPAVKRAVKISGEITVGDLAKAMGIKLAEVILQLLNLGIKATVNQLIDFETATLIAAEFGVETTNIEEDKEELLALIKEPDNPEDLEFRPPVVTVMGHVDHGKTSLLDAIRETSVSAKEFGGITQHIGAYNVRVPSGGAVTFLDTPGHEAFTAMRSRGAQITDIVVLVVAADDGIMPQTVEAINHAKAAEVPIIVAVNKIDKEAANIDRVKQHLAEQGLVPEDWGGETITVGVSAHTKEGIDLLLENLQLQAEVLELKANPNRKAFGTVVESKLDKGRGPLMTVLVQNGTLAKGDIFVAGRAHGKVRALIGDDGQQVESAGPSIPVEVLGASVLPVSGDEFFILESESDARKIAEDRSLKARSQKLATRAGVAGDAPLTLESFSDMVKGGQAKELPVIVKADVQGSSEAVSDYLMGLSTDEVQLNIVHRGVGAVSETDVQLGVASKALLVAFNVRGDTRATALASREGLQILYSRVIYEVGEKIKAAMSGLLDPKFQEKTLGRVEVRQTFKVPRIGVVAGSYVLDGIVQRGASVRLMRDDRVVFEGKMASLRRFKDDVKEVQAGYECGIGIEGYSDIHDGDVIEVFTVEEVRPQLS